MRLVRTTFVALACLASCATDRDHVAEEVREAARGFEAAERARDVEGLVAFLAPDFYMYQDGVRVDRAATVAQIHATMPTLARFEPRFEDLEVIVLSADAAVTTMVFHDEITDARGAVSRMTGPSTLVWRRGADGWRIVFADSDHYEPEE